MCYLVLMTVKLRSYSGVRQFKTTAIKEVSMVQLPHYFSNSDIWCEFLAKARKISQYTEFRTAEWWLSQISPLLLYTYTHFHYPLCLLKYRLRVINWNISLG